MPKTRAKTQTNASVQLNFINDLFKQLDEYPGELLPLQSDSHDVGGAVLSILSKGLYTDPLDCIREYVQNAVDAKSTDVTIKITGNSVIISDKGHGMELSDIVQARQFGVSLKSQSEHVGFRGIGIYSGFDLCRRLRITTTKRGSSYLYVLVFEFADMKSELDRDKHRKSDEKISLTRLLSNYTFIKRESEEVPLNLHFTQVELQDISDIHIRRLSNRAEMRRYLLKNLPIDFGDDFKYKKDINAQLAMNVPGYNAVQIILQSDGLTDEVVSKDAIPNLRAPTFGIIKNASADQEIAFYWSCLNEDRGRIEPKSRRKEDTPRKQSSYEGFVYKVKGFTIGNSQKLLPMFSKAALYRWYTGEIYVLDENVVPNAERDDFETNQSKIALEMAVQQTLTDLEKIAAKVQATGVANDRIEAFSIEVDDIEKMVADNSFENEFDVYSRLSHINQGITEHRPKADPEKRQLANKLVDRIDQLQNRLKTDVGKGTSEAVRRKRAVRNKRPDNQVPIPVVTSLPSPPVKTLQDIFREVGWELEGDAATLIKLFQESLEDVLSTSSSAYRNLLSDIEAKLMNLNSNE